MVVARIEMWPGGDHKRKFTLAIGTWACLGVAQRDDPAQGVRKGERAYRVRLFKDTSFNGPDGSDPDAIVCPRARDVWKEHLVRGHMPGPRGVWDLLGGALDVLLGGRLRGYTADRTDHGKPVESMTERDVTGPLPIDGAERERVIAFGNAYYRRLLQRLQHEAASLPSGYLRLTAQGLASHTARLVEAFERGDHLGDHGAALDAILGGQPDDEPMETL